MCNATYVGIGVYKNKIKTQFPQFIQKEEAKRQVWGDAVNEVRVTRSVFMTHNYDEAGLPHHRARSTVILQ